VVAAGATVITPRRSGPSRIRGVSHRSYTHSAKDPGWDPQAPLSAVLLSARSTYWYQFDGKTVFRRRTVTLYQRLILATGAYFGEPHKHCWLSCS